MLMIEDRALNQQIMRPQSAKLAIDIYFERRITAEVVADDQPRVATDRKVVTDSCYICNKKIILKRRKTRKCCTECKNPVL